MNLTHTNESAIPPGRRTGIHAAALLIASFAVACTDHVVTPVEVESLELSPGSVTVTAGDTVRISAIIRDRGGNELFGRPLNWSTSDMSIATVDAAGLVRALAPGTATVSAEGNGIVDSARVIVEAPPRILLERASVEFRVTEGDPDPDAQSLGVTNGGGGELADLGVAVTYRTGDGWLDVALSGATAPATLSLRPRLRDLPAGVFSADVVLASPVADNSPQTVFVELEVLTRPDPVPEAPTNLQVISESAKSIELTWRHDGEGVAVFRLERRRDESFAEVAVIDAGDRTYTDGDLEKSTRYVYRIRACAADGRCSGYSNERTGRTRGN